MRVHWLQHAEHEDSGCIEPWLRERGHRVSRTRLYAGEALPAVRDFDWLVVMGGPMNIYEHERYPWLLPEKALISDACVMNKRVLGLCLGGQLIADALGGPVTRNNWQEIGWFDVDLTSEARKMTLCSDLPSRFNAFHWHGDTFAIPPGATHLMRSAACSNQGFSRGPRVLGLQFHLEVTEANARDWLRVEPTVPSRYVQGADQILADPARFEQNNRLMRLLLARMEAAD